MAEKPKSVWTALSEQHESASDNPGVQRFAERVLPTAANAAVTATTGSSAAGQAAEAAARSLPPKEAARTILVAGDSVTGGVFSKVVEGLFGNSK